MFVDKNLGTSKQKQNKIDIGDLGNRNHLFLEQLQRKKTKLDTNTNHYTGKSFSEDYYKINTQKIITNAIGECQNL